MRGWSEYELSVRSMFHSLQYQHGMVKAKFQRCFHWKRFVKRLILRHLNSFRGEDMVYITEEQRKLLDRWSALTRKQQELFLELFEKAYRLRE